MFCARASSAQCASIRLARPIKIIIIISIMRPPSHPRSA